MSLNKSFSALLLTAAAFSAIAVGQKPETDKKPASSPPAAPPPAAKTIEPPKKLLRVKGEPIAFPEIEGWVKRALVRYPSPELGYSVNYDSEYGRVSVYVYNGGRKDIANTLTGAVKDEIEKAFAEIKIYGEMGHYSDIKLDTDETIKVGGKEGKIDSLHKVITMKVQGETARSEIFVFPFEGNFIKLRVTRRMPISPESEAALAKLLAEVDRLFVALAASSDTARTAAP